MKKRLLKRIAWFMVLLMFLTIIPTPVIASIAGDFKGNPLITATIEKSEKREKTAIEEPLEAEIVSELKEKRMANEKHFLMNDGTTQVAIYPEAVHYEKNGQWQDIDNSLIENKNKDHYELKENAFNLSFAKDKSSFSVKNKGFNLTYRLKESNKVEAEIRTDITDESQIQGFSFENDYPPLQPYLKKEKDHNSKFLELKKNGSEVTYKNVLKNTDIRYDVIGNKVKETITLNDKKAVKKEYVYELLYEGLELKQESKNEIHLINPQNNEVIYYLVAPYMYDANQEYNNNINLSLKDHELTMTLDEKWLNDEARKFPIVIDPTVFTSQNINAIEDLYTLNTSTGGVDAVAHFLRIGTYSGGSANPLRSFIKFTLPSINAGDQIIGARLYISSYFKNTNDYVNPPSNVVIDAHKVTVNWSENNATFNGLNNKYDSRITDYFIYSYDNSNSTKTHSVDITSMVKDWYVNGNNYGVMLKEHEESVKSGRSDARFLSSNTSNQYYGDLRPIAVIDYRNQTGLEDYMTYHTYDVGRAGTIYTNDYNGNVVLTHQSASTPGSRMPINLTHIYNSNDKAVDIGFGLGFSLNYSQTIERITIPNSLHSTYLRYIDEDGTRHYFYQDNGVWQDEDGLDLTITNSSGYWVLEDKTGNKSTFEYNALNNKWHLWQLTDTNNNKIYITLDSYNAAITKITDSAGQELIFNYAYGHVANIKDTNNQYTYYSYSGDHLVNINYKDNKNAYYEYNNYSLAKVINVDSSYTTLEYYTAGTTRVKTVKEYGSGATLGMTQNITYSESGTNFVDNKGAKETYNFNSVGNTINVTTGDLTTAYGTSEAYTNNKITGNTQLIKPVINQVTNPGAERNMEAWWQENWDANQGTVTTATTEKYYGAKSFKINTPTKTNITTALIQVAQMPKGKTYTLSAYLKTNITESEADGGAYLAVWYYDANNQMKWEYGPKITSTNGWERHSMTFEYKAQYIGDLRYGVVMKNAKGDIFVDAIQVEEGLVMNPYTLLENGGFERSETAWTRSGLNSQGDVIYTEAGNNYFQLLGQPNGTKNINQRIEVAGNVGEAFTITGMVKNHGVYNDSDLVKEAKVAIDIHLVNGNMQRITEYIEPNSQAWQHFSKTFVAEGNYDYIVVYLCFNKQANYIFYDHLSLFKDLSGESYTYDANGNLISAKDLAKQNSTFNYDSKNQLTNMINPDGTSFTYTYDANIKNRLTKAVNQNNISYNLAYDAYGNATNFQVKDSNNAKYIESSVGYNNNGRFVTSTTDPLGNTSTLNYNTSTGTLTNITDPNNNTTNYTYDTLGRILTANSDQTTISYTYNNDRLSKINHNANNYNFNYDPFGNISNIKIGNQTLIANNYAINNGNLTSSVYGNNQTISYTYDQFDRVSKTTNSLGIIDYYYDNFSNLTKIKNNYDNITKQYTYDLANRLVNYQEDNNYSISNTYDNKSNVANISYKLGSNTKTTNFTYDSTNRLTDINDIKYVYDSLNRISDKKINNNYIMTYLYEDINANKTTDTIRGIQNGNELLSYEYDANSNITRVLKNNIETNQYYYDSKNQLIKDDQSLLNQSAEYSYDDYGNLLSKEIYDISTNPKTLIDTKSYAYGNDNWKDQLTNYNGKLITYDNIGNPTSIGSSVSMS